MKSLEVFILKSHPDGILFSSIIGNNSLPSAEESSKPLMNTFILIWMLLNGIVTVCVPCSGTVIVKACELILGAKYRGSAPLLSLDYLGYQN